MTWINPKRSVDPGARRRQTREILIYNREDLNRALTEAYKNPTRISVLKLAADIVLTADMQINQCNVTIDGGNLYGFTASSLLYTITSYADLTLVNLRNNNVKFNILNVPFKIDTCIFSTDSFQFETAVDITVNSALTNIRAITISDSTFHNFNIPFACAAILGGQYVQLSANNISLSTDTAQALVISTDCKATIYDLKYLNLLNDDPGIQLTINIDSRSIINNCSLTNLVITGGATDCVVSNNCFFNGGWDSSAAVRTYYVNNSIVATKVFGTGDLDLDSSLPNASGNQINVDAAAAPAIGDVLTATSATTATWQPAGGGGSPAIGGTITGGTAGSVLFVDPAATIAEDNANFFFDNANNRLGIGTAVPLSRLHLAGSSGILVESVGSQWAVLGADVAGSNYMTLRRPGTTAALGYIGGGAGGSISGGSSSDLGIRSEASLYIATNGNVPQVIVDTSGNVGIGNFTPTQKLHVAGETLIDGGGSLRLQTTTPGSDGIIKFIEPAGALRTSVYYAGTDLLRIADTTTDRLVIDSTGNVGIGTTAPTSRLSVGASSEFQVNSTGDIVKINNVITTFPAAQGAPNTYLKNDGAGTLTWATVSGGGGTFGTANITFSRSIHSITTTILDAGVSALSNILVAVGIPSTRDLDEMELAPVVCAVGSIVPGVSFDVIVVSLDGDAEGVYTVKYTRS